MSAGRNLLRNRGMDGKIGIYDKICVLTECKTSVLFLRKTGDGITFQQEYFTKSLDVDKKAAF